jgi:hypothetical protein
LFAKKYKKNSRTTIVYCGGMRSGGGIKRRKEREEVKGIKKAFGNYSISLFPLSFCVCALLKIKCYDPYINFLSFLVLLIKKWFLFLILKCFQG